MKFVDDDEDDDDDDKAVDMRIDEERITATTANSLIRHCVSERDCSPLLKGCGQALEQKCYFSGLLDDDSDASADLLHQLFINVVRL